MNCDYLLTFRKIAELPDTELIEELKCRSGLKLSDMLVSHLVYENNNFNKPILYGNGVYVFKDPERFIYVGSCAYRNFLERIPAHLDVRTTAWMNSLAVNIRKHWNMTDLEEAVKYAFDNCSLFLINFEKNEEITDWKVDVAIEIRKLEKKLINLLRPLNKR